MYFDALLDLSAGVKEIVRSISEGILEIDVNLENREQPNANSYWENTEKVSRVGTFKINTKMTPSKMTSIDGFLSPVSTKFTSAFSL